jgi:hypothetical protein
MALLTRDEVLGELAEIEGFGERTFQLGATHSEFTTDEKGNMLFTIKNGSVQEYKLSRDAFVKASRMCGIPESYVDKFPDDGLSLLNDHLNYWFRTRDDDMKMLLRGDTVVSFLKPSTAYYSRTHLFEIAERIMEYGSAEPLLYDQVHSDLVKGTHYSIVSHKGTFVKPGDLIQAGVQVQDHVLGELPFIVSGYVFRQICGNGMISQDLVSKWSRHADESNLDSWFREAVEACNESIEQEFQRTKDLQDIPVDKHGSDIIRAIFSEYKISNKMREAITDNVVDEGAENLYDVFNAITSAANNEEFQGNPQAVRMLQAVAGSVAAHPQFCPSCFSLVRS